MTVVYPENPGAGSEGRIKLTLSEFLLARYAEEAADADMRRGDDWHVEGRSWRHDESRPVLVGGGKILARLYEGEEASVPDHIVRWNPERVLADVTAKRRIVEAESGWTTTHPDAPPHTRGSFDGEGEFIELPTPFGSTRLDGEAAREFTARWYVPAEPRRTLKILASVYADHPDYREEWRP